MGEGGARDRGMGRGDGEIGMERDGKSVRGLGRGERRERKKWTEGNGGRELRGEGREGERGSKKGKGEKGRRGRIERTK